LKDKKFRQQKLEYVEAYLITDMKLLGKKKGKRCGAFSSI
jgi:hypothetical protein